MTLSTQLVRFCAAGVVIIGVDVGLYTALAQGLPRSLSKGLSFIGAGAVAYGLNKYWIFESRQRGATAAGRFAFFNLFAFGVNVLTHQGVLRLWPEAVWGALGIATAVTSAVSFVGFKWWVFRPLP